MLYIPLLVSVVFIRQGTWLNLGETTLDTVTVCASWMAGLLRSPQTSHQAPTAPSSLQHLLREDPQQGSVLVHSH